MATAKDIKKDTIYIDVDDDITTIIEKLRGSGEKIVAMVLPKRASVFQSVVNMKLLKRAAEQSKKNIVLITSEAALLPLAGAVGMHVASSLQSRPSIPASPDSPKVQLVDEETGQELDDFSAEQVADEPIGKLAGGAAIGTAAAGAGAAAASRYSDPETIELDNDAPSAPAASGIGSGLAGAGTAAAATNAGGAAGAADKAAKGKDKKLKIPNFNKFRIVLFAGLALLLLLGGGFIYASTSLAKAVVTIKTDSTDINTKADLALDPKATEVDIASDTLPAKVATKQQTASQQVSTSGSKNNGTKATGSVQMTVQYCNAPFPTDSPNDVPAGTGVSSGGKTFITQTTTTFPDTGSFKSGCVTYQATKTTNVTAQTGGADYNIAAASFTVAGRSDVTAKSSDAMSGGTDNIVKVVTQADIDSAKSKITSDDSKATIRQELTKKLQADGYTALAASLNVGEPSVTPSAAVGDQADTVTVNSATTYTLYGYKQSDLKTIVTTSVKKQINTAKQVILKDGVSQAKFQVSSSTASGPLSVGMTAVSLAGPDIRQDQLPGQLAGKKTGEVNSILKAIPGVTDVSVKYSPSWVSKVPGDESKITINVEKAD